MRSSKTGRGPPPGPVLDRCATPPSHLGPSPASGGPPKDRRASPGQADGPATMPAGKPGARGCGPLTSSPSAISPLPPSGRGGGGEGGRVSSPVFRLDRPFIRSIAWARLRGRADEGSGRWAVLHVRPICCPGSPITPECLLPRSEERGSPQQPPLLAEGSRGSGQAADRNNARAGVQSTSGGRFPRPRRRGQPNESHGPPGEE